MNDIDVDENSGPQPPRDAESLSSARENQLTARWDYLRGAQLDRRWDIATTPSDGTDPLTTISHWRYQPHLGLKAIPGIPSAVAALAGGTVPAHSGVGSPFHRLPRYLAVMLPGEIVVAYDGERVRCRPDEDHLWTMRPGVDEWIVYRVKSTRRPPYTEADLAESYTSCFPLLDAADLSAAVHLALKVPMPKPLRRGRR
jgi:hypothetical protein